MPTPKKSGKSAKSKKTKSAPIISPSPFKRQEFITFVSTKSSKPAKRDPKLNKAIREVTSSVAGVALHLVQIDGRTMTVRMDKLGRVRKIL